jgi:hypothetical protein
MADADTPCMGKIYYACFKIQESLAEVDLPAAVKEEVMKQSAITAHVQPFFPEKLLQRQANNSSNNSTCCACPQRSFPAPCPSPSLTLSASGSIYKLYPDFARYRLL